MSTTKARELRRNLTDAERTLWRELRRHQMGGHKLRRQQPLGPYIVDVVCFEKRLIIELDGGQHAEEAIHDSERTAWLETQGFRVLRFWNDQVFRERGAVLEQIANALG